METTQSMIHETAEVSPDAQIGSGTKIWHQAQVREGAVIGKNCIIGKDVYIDFGVIIGDNVKIQNGALIYHGVTIEDGVFVGPQVCITNDRTPRAITHDGRLKREDDWTVEPILVRYGASIGAGAILIPPVTIGRFAMVAAGSVVTKNVPDHVLAVGVPAHLVGYVCPCGQKLVKLEETWRCPICEWELEPVGEDL
jgi:UDP-2-acetamido-3-amino-2,3-dideoxy-glucuronate N-acetyltransferase